MEQDKVDLMAKLAQASEVFMEAMKEIEADEEAYWNSLSKEDQLKCFCAVSRRIHRGEIVDKGTYRWVLYDVFGFGPEAYASAQMAGYLAIHNAIYDSDHEGRVLEKFAKHLGVENPEKAVSEFYEGYL